MEQISGIKTYLFVTPKPWHDSLFENLQQRIPGKWVRVSRPEDFTLQRMEELQPDIIFLPHWSQIIPEAIHRRYTCIVFHMTDLPFGRGGSPLQNLIVRGFKTTVVSALKVEQGIDTGPVYLKSPPVSLEGTAQEIFMRCSVEIGHLIQAIIRDHPVPQQQTGEVVHFKRRKPEESNLALLNDPDAVYDHIRMLDCDGYPPAFIETEHFRIEFSQAALSDNQTITAHARIIKK